MRKAERRGSEKRDRDGSKGTSAAWGFGLARSTRYPFSPGVPSSPYLSLLRFERVPPLSPLRERTKSFPFQRYTSPAGGRRSQLQTAAFRGRLVSFPYSLFPTMRHTAILASEPYYAPATVTSL